MSALLKQYIAEHFLWLNLQNKDVFEFSTASVFRRWSFCYSSSYSLDTSTSYWLINAEPLSTHRLASVCVCEWVCVCLFLSWPMFDPRCTCSSPRVITRAHVQPWAGSPLTHCHRPVWLLSLWHCLSGSSSEWGGSFSRTIFYQGLDLLTGVDVQEALKEAQRRARQFAPHQTVFGETWLITRWAVVFTQTTNS